MAVWKDRNLILILIEGILLGSLISMPSVNAQPYYAAYFTSIKVTHGNDDIELASGGTAEVYDGQSVWTNLTFYNEKCGVVGADLYTTIYAEDILIGNSSKRHVLKETYSSDHWSWAIIFGPALLRYRVELWCNLNGTHYLEDIKYFGIKVVKLFVASWSPANLSVEKGKTVPSTLSIGLDNGGNDYMYDVEMLVVDSEGLEIAPQSQSLGNISSDGTKSTTFLITAPIGAALGEHVISFRIDYDDFRGVSHSEIKTVPIIATKLGTSMTLNLEPSSVKVGGSTTLTATLVDGNGNPIANQSIRFHIVITPISSANTDSSGRATKAYTTDVDPGTYMIMASYYGGEDYLATITSSNLDVKPFATTLATDVGSATQGKEWIMRATLEDENGNPIQDATIEFQIYNGTKWLHMDFAETDSNGVASTSYIPLETGKFQVRAMFSGTTNYTQSSTSADLNVAMDYTPYWLGSGIIAVIIVGVVGYVILRRRKR